MVRPEGHLGASVSAIASSAVCSAFPMRSSFSKNSYPLVAKSPLKEPGKERTCGVLVGLIAIHEIPPPQNMISCSINAPSELAKNFSSL